ncbi:unnamed protein product [Diabrotica balteata]|uniref:Uncharacterized protein n=1 Tax=Diabrotica balteata TaxID=107213 RepID=A0A9P0H0A5_DIABA|nr:unnamed protein product [Diabrotica balteata]
MVMGQFVTTYRKDYLWPYVKTLGLRPEPDHIYSPQYRDQIYCKCHCLPALPATSQQRTLIGPEALQDEEWSRLGPMGPLLEPKVFTAKVSAAPESEVSRFNQPNVFMAKIKEKYPFIYECLRTAPPDDLIARINKDRLASSYQVDYCHKLDPFVLKEPIQQNCPRSPPGPYYRPYDLHSCLVFNKDLQAICDKNNDQKTSCMHENYFNEITRWQPFEKRPFPSSDIVDKWGKMIFRRKGRRSHS